MYLENRFIVSKRAVCKCEGVLSPPVFGYFLLLARLQETEGVREPSQSIYLFLECCGPMLAVSNTETKLILLLTTLLSLPGCETRPKWLNFKL